MPFYDLLHTVGGEKCAHVEPKRTKFNLRQVWLMISQQASHEKLGYGLRLAYHIAGSYSAKQTLESSWDLRDLCACLKIGYPTNRVFGKMKINLNQPICCLPKF